MKRILFKASSPFTNFTAILIGTLYYPNEYKILLLDSVIYEGYEKKIVELELFNEVHVISESNKKIHHVEQQVSHLLQILPDIDEYFMNTFSDCYSILIAYRLLGKATLHVFPEGGTTVWLERVIHLILERGDVASRDPDRNLFFKKYPVDLSFFDYTWMYDLSIPQGSFRAKKRLISIADIINIEDGRTLINKMNDLFRYYSVPKIQCCFMDAYLSKVDNLDIVAEHRILDALFEVIGHEDVVVKPHPPNSMLPYTEYKFQNRPALVLKNANVPWELMLLNILQSGQKELTLIVLQLEGTYVMTSLAMIPSDFQLTIITLNKLEEEFFSEYLATSYALNYDYYNDAINRPNVKVYMPESLNELYEIGQKHKGVDLENYKPSIYFKKVGNLLENSFLYDDNGTFFSEAYYVFLDDTCNIVFNVNKEVSFGQIIWRPSSSDMFISAENIKVTLEKDNDAVEQFEIYRCDEMKRFAEGRLTFDYCFSGYCNRISISASLMVYKKFCNLSKELFDRKWRGTFWERWYDIVTYHMMERFKVALEGGAVWIYGMAKIGKAIAKEFMRWEIEYMYIVSEDWRAERGDDVRIITDINSSDEMPAYIVVTPMYDYDYILCTMYERFRKIALSLNAFTDLILSLK